MLRAKLPAGASLAARAQQAARAVLLCVLSLSLCAPPAWANPGARPVSAQARDAFVEKQLDAIKKAAEAPVDVRPQAATAAPGSAAAIQVSAEPLSDGVMLRYSWDRDVPAAAALIGDTLWVAFGSIRDMDHARADKLLRPRILAVGQADGVDGTLLRYRLRPDSHVGMRRDGNSWIVTVKDSPLLPRIALQAELIRDPVAGTQRFVAVEAPGQVLRLTEPTSGQTLFLALSGADSAGVIEAIDLPDARLLPSAQGVLMLPLTPRAQALRNERGFALVHTDGTAIVPGSRTLAGHDAPNADGSLKPLLNTQAWKTLVPGAFAQGRKELQYRLSMAKPGEQQARRWDLASYLFAHGFHADAMAVMTLMARRDANLINIPQFRATRGIAALHLAQYAKAGDDLGQLSLDVEPEAWLWRSLLFARQGRHAEALDAYARGGDILGKLPEAQRFAFQLPMVEAALATGATAMAARELSLMPAVLGERDAAAVRYWRGRVAQAEGRLPQASRFYADAKAAADASGAVKVSAMARFAEVDTALALKQLSPAQAIAKLDPLRFAWRGDSVELRLLNRLADLYGQSGDYRAALTALRTGVTYFKPDDTTRAMARRMDALFLELFLQGKADSMEPAKALALFADFRELTPLGADGDTMIRSLADRLVHVNLLGRAGGLLEHQVLYRLEGVAQAQIAGRLAMVRLLDNQPAKALEALRSTRQAAMPEDLLASRNRIEARALIDLRRLDEAEAMIDGDSSRDATLLRSDIAWEAKDWVRLAEIGDALLSSQQGALSDDDRRLVIRTALALSLSNQSARLASLRTRFSARMSGGAYADAFDTLTSTQEIDVSDIQSLSKSLVGIDRLQSVFDAYRAEFARPPAQTAATPPPAPAQAG